ncbi:MAG: carboxypeptidase-like regulatory domain-containing protein [Acidimicrobiales bacterium]
MRHRIDPVRPQRRLWLAAVALMVLSGCGGSDEPEPEARPVPTSAPASSTTLVPAPAPVSPTLPGVRRTTTTGPTAGLGPGGATLAGTITGPEGPLAGAVVRVERLIGGGPAADLRTDEQGGWSLASIQGGPYRVVAFRPPDLGALEPTLVFVAASERRDLPIGLSRFGENTITARLDPTPARVGVTSTLAVRVGTGRVGSDGAVVVVGRASASMALASDGLEIESPSQQADGDGRVRWRVRCRAAGAVTVSLRVGQSSTTVPFPACGEAPLGLAPTTTMPAPEDQADGRATEESDEEPDEDDE